MTEVRDMDKTVGECDDCGNIFVIVDAESGEFMLGGDECPECGSEEFSILEYNKEDI